MDRRIRGAALACVLLVTGVATGCATEPPAESRRPTAPSRSVAPTGSPTGSPGGEAGARAGVEAAYAKWGLEPLAAAPAPPDAKPVGLPAAAGPVPVISEIPTQEKIVFLTFDDGAEKDPEFLTMMRELKIPFTMFLTDSAISADYGYFGRLQALGDGVQNHTLTHPNLRTLGAAAQKREICGQQTKLKDRYGTAPRLFRPPYGNWNEDTRAAAASCGIEAIVLWRESMQIKNMQYQRGDKQLHPGDIVLAHFRGPSELKGTTMTEMTANMLRHIQEQGFTVARLEDYL
ncbi:polysaccharide deacetylase family protein [Streptomyces rishiriensis]|uniref:Peptidoglycan/xylan/chitin deacetylase (PgdA/CDA1 family) n=1 Tax=Streptomyces rishiriensis TaxID=68264 RepID=A0ABU0NV06_STRRH|nr:polysaccharide deacetylase family protein [Streptomyces rishiriensis]MDQ0582357.1 peptidoglycan/xylan/chitin deacetylase (PgdA/CDA1 family) [Streptomyces rishiriensis]